MADQQRDDRAAWEGELFRLLVRNVRDYAIFVVDPEGLVRSWSHGAERLLGYRADEVLGRSSDRFFTPEDLEAGMPRRERQQALETGRGEDDRWHIRKDGERFWSSGVLTPLWDEGGTLRGFAKIMRDRTQLWHAEQARREGEGRRAAQLALTRVLAEASDVREAAPRIVRTLGESLGWEAGVFLLVDRDDRVLRCLDAWHAPGSGAGPIEEVSRRSTFAPGAGLPGRAWASGGPAWLTDPADAPDCPRRGPAAALGLRSAFAFPVWLGAEVLGVVEGFGREARAPDTDLLEMLATLGGQVGQFVERTRAEAAVLERDRQLQFVADHAPVLIAHCDPQQRFRFVNRPYAARFGLDPADLVGRAIPDVLGEEAYAVIRPHVEAVLAGRRVEFEAEVPYKDLGTQHMRCAYEPERDAEGRVVGYVASITNITDRIRAERALREGEERLRLALEAGRMGVWDWNVRTGELKWSDNLEAVHGLPPGTFGGTFEAFRRLIHPDDLALVERAIARSLETSSSYDIEFRNLWPDGGVHWMSGKGQVFSEGGRPARMIGVGMDITDRKRSEQDARFLADASAMLAALVDDQGMLQQVARLAVPSFCDWCAVDMLEEDGALRRVAVAHVDPAKVELARELHRRFPPDPEAPRGAWSVIRTGASELVGEVSDDALEAAVKHPDLLEILRDLGLKSWIVVPLRVRGKVLGAATFLAAESGRRYDERDLAVAEDLAHRAAVAVENARLYREVREADRRKDEFLATLAHELRNPLAPIRNSLEILRRAGDDPEQLDQARATMERQVRAMTRLIDDLLDISRISRNRLELRTEPVALAAVVQAAVETSRPLIEESGQTLTVSLPAEPIELEADPTRLAQVFANLLNNAAKYTERGGQIALAAERRGGEAVVSVRDTGVGIPEEMVPKIFDMFTQVDRSLERSQGGLGIGLTLVKRLVELHGGSVEARSEGVGRGSEFVVRLPVRPGRPAAERPGERPPSAAAAAAATPRRVLVVDDNHDAARTLARLLTMVGNQVQTAHDGEEAVAAAADFRPDVVLLDIGLPRLNGYDAARRIREEPWGRPMVLVALTGWGQEDDRRRSSEAGFDHHLVKPVDPDALLGLLGQPFSRG